MRMRAIFFFIHFFHYALQSKCLVSEYMYVQIHGYYKNNRTAENRPKICRLWVLDM